MGPRLKFLMIGIVLIGGMEWRTVLFYLLPAPDYSQGNIVLYATSWCPYCEKTRALLAQHHIPYKEFDIERSEEGNAQYLRLAGKGVPVLLIDREVIRGFNERKIIQALTTWQAQQTPNKGLPEKIEANR